MSQTVVPFVASELQRKTPRLLVSGEEEKDAPYHARLLASVCTSFWAGEVEEHLPYTMSASFEGGVARTFTLPSILPVDLPRAVAMRHAIFTLLLAYDLASDSCAGLTGSVGDRERAPRLDLPSYETGAVNDTVLEVFRRSAVYEEGTPHLPEHGNCTVELFLECLAAVSFSFTSTNTPPPNTYSNLTCVSPLPLSIPSPLSYRTLCRGAEPGFPGE
jgi:hypothetical protein